MTLTALLTGVLLLATAAPASSRDVAGLWRTPIDGGLVRVERCGVDLCGRVAGSARLRAFPDQKDARNRDPTLRQRAIKGLLIFKLHATNPGRWGGGTIYNPDDGGTYKADLKMTVDGRIQVRGCVVEPICRTQTWTRAQ